MSLHNFNPNNKSWKMYTNTITSINGDNLTIKPYDGKNLLLEVSANNNILFKRGDISYGLDDLIGGGNSTIILTSVSGDIIPYIDNAFNLGDISKNWNNAYIQNISATHISISGDFILNISGTAINLNTRLGVLDTSFINVNTRLGVIDTSFINVNTRLGVIDSSFINVNTRLGVIDSSFITLLTLRDLSVNNAMTISGNLIPLNPIASDLGSTNNLWRNAYIQNISATHMTISGNISVSGNIVPLNNNNNSDLGLSTRRWNNLYVSNIDMSGTISNVRDICNVRQIIPRLGGVSDISTSLGTSSNIWQRAFINDLSGIISINGATWPLTSGGGGTSDFSGTNITTSLIPRDTSSIDLGSSSKLWRNAYIQDLSVSNISVSGNITICGSPVYTKTQIDASFVSKQSFDTSYNTLLTAIGNTGTSTTNYDTTLTIKNTIDLNEIHDDSNWYYKGQLVNKTSCITGLGKTLALSDDGRTIVIGSNKNGLANVIPEIYVYYFIENTWVQKGTTIVGPVGKYFGKKVAISGNGEVISVSDVKGNIYLYKWKYNISTTNNYNPILGAWTKLGAPITRENGHGISMSLNYSGDKMVCGSYLTRGDITDSNNDGQHNWLMITLKTPPDVTINTRTFNPYAICWNGSIFCMVGAVELGFGYATTSIDGITWTSIKYVTTNRLKTIAWNGKIFCALSFQGIGSCVVISSDGIIWDSVPLTTNNSGSWQHMCFSPLLNLFCACATNAFITSTDGINWFRVAVSGTWYSICYGKNIFVAVGNNIIATSIDGIIWSTLPRTGTWVCITANELIFCAISDTGQAIISSDGISWIFTQQLERPGYGTLGAQICWNGKIFCFFTSNQVAYYSYDGIFWQTESIVKTGSGNHIFGWGTAWNGHRFCTVGYAEGQPASVVVSPINFPNNSLLYVNDYLILSNWNAYNSPKNNTWTSICWGYDKFVAVANSGSYNNRVIYSSDGVNWSTATIGVLNNSWSSVFWGNNTFCAVANGGSENRFMISYNGIEWKSISTNMLAINFYSVTFGYVDNNNPTFCAVGTSSVGTTGGVNGFAVSSDGLNWRFIGGPNQFLKCICWGNNMFVAISNNAATASIVTSVNGINWTSRNKTTANILTSVCWGNDKFVAVASSGTGNRVITSLDGITWATQTSIPDSIWTSVVWGTNIFVAVANAGTSRIMSSPDGITWTSRSAPIINNWISITYNGSIFCAISSTQLSANGIIISSDGINWTTTNPMVFNNSWNSITWNGSIFCAVASSGIARVKISSNGSDWSNSINGVINNSWNSICWNGALFCAVASSGNNNERVMISSNGLNWSNATSGVLNNNWSALCWNGTIFCALASSGDTNQRVMISVNGLVWTNATSGVLDNYWSALCWNGTIFCAIASSGSTNQRVMTSTNGLTWNNSSSNVPDNSWNSICWNGYIFCAVASSGTNRVMISTNGINWTSYNMNLPDTYWSSICWNGNFFCAVANGGLGNRVATSYDGIVWTSRTSIYENNNWNSICWNGTIFCAIASSGVSRAMTSSINYGKEYSYKIVKQWFYVSGQATRYNYTGGAVDKLGLACLIYNNGATAGYQFFYSSAPNLFYSGPTGTLLDWFTDTMTFQNQWASICVSDTSYCAVATSGSGNNRAITLGINSGWSNRVWLASTSGVVDSQWTSVCWNGSIFCAVARSGASTNQQVMISSSGRVWQNATSGVPDSSWVSVCWGNTMFCAVANNGTERVMTSLDGLTWTGRVSNPSDSNWTSITWGNNLFCAVANSGTLRVMISYDGITWTGIESDPPSNNWTSVTWGNNIFCAVANQGNGNRVMTSPDGVSWISQTSINNSWNYVFWGKNIFFALSDSQSNGKNIMFSSTLYGKEMSNISDISQSYWFTQYLSDNVANLTSIIWGNNIFCAIGTSYAITSTNGDNWNKYYLGDTNTYINLCYANNTFLARNQNSKSLIRSTNNGVNWTSYTLSAMLSEPTWNSYSPMIAKNMFFIAFDNFTSVFSLGVQLTNRIMYSYNGIDFSLCITPNTTMSISTIAWSDKLKIFVAGMAFGSVQILLSNDGIIWYYPYGNYIDTTISPPNSVSIIWSPLLEIFVLFGTGNNPRIYRSSDGTAWYRSSRSINNSHKIFNSFINQPLISALWTGAYFITYNTKILLTSPNGNDFTIRQTNSYSNIDDSIKMLASSPSGIICGIGTNNVNTTLIIRFSDNYGYDFPGVAFKNGTVRIYDIQDINYVPPPENNFGHREIGYFETANESEKNSLSVEMSGDGKTVVAGFPSSDSSGNSVKIYTYENNTWKSLVNQIKDLSLNSNYNFGTCVATSANGSIIAVAAMSSNNITNGYVKVYKAQNTYPKTYVQLGNTIETNFGTPITFYNSSGFDVSYQNNLLNDISFQNKCLALSANGYVLTIGNMNDFNTKGSVRTYIYNTTNNSWNVIKDISGVNIGDRYGLEVHMPKYDYDTLAWSADPSGISTSLINYGSTGTITY